MPCHTASRHARRERDLCNSPERSSGSGETFTIIRPRHAQEVGTTASRQLRRASDFLAATRYMVRHHPQAGPTTLRLAAVFAARMHRNRHGHIAFNVAATVDELGVSRRTVLTHARYLRELGLLAWVEHGSKRNVLRTRARSWAPGDGYRGTATIYAPVAPPLWDRIQGYRIRGSGYGARLVGVTEEGRQRAIAAARSQARRLRAQPQRCTPSVVVTSAASSLQVAMGGKKNMRRPLKRRRPRSTDSAPAFTASDCQRAISLTEQVQREVWWLYGACSRRIAYALRPLLAAGWTAAQLAAEIGTWGVPAHLKDPAAYVHHQLIRRCRRAELLPAEPRAVVGPTADDGSRYEAMLRSRAEHAPSWQSYTRHLRPALRDELSQRRQLVRQSSRTATQPYQPLLRECEEVFLASLPAETWADPPSPRQIYAARAQAADPRRGQHLRCPDAAWLRHLREHTEAARACDALRVQWEERDLSGPPASPAAALSG